MKLRKAETATIAITIAALIFTGGYFIGRGSSGGVVYISPLSSETVDAGSESSGPDASLPDTTQNSPPGAPQSATPAATDTPAPDTPAVVPRPGKININTASAEELIDLPGIGEVLAGRIIAYREKHGPFKKISDIDKVSGIGPAKYEAIKDLITVE